MGAIPLLIWAYEYGPNPGYCGVPNENGTCTASGCHTGVTNSSANKGSVAIAFPNGMTYTPGVVQHLTVTISDPVTTQTAWGFQATPRMASSPSTMAGSVVPTDKNTLIMCSQANLFIFTAVCMPGADSQGRCTQMAAPACPSADTALQYIEHSYTGYLSTMGTGSGTYHFDWTPPASNVGNITFYIAGNAGVGGPPTQDGDHIYATSYTLTPQATLSGPPTVTNVISASGFGAFTSAAPGSYIEVYGSNMAAASDTRTWQTSDFSGNNAPTQLDGTKVTVGGQAAYVSFLSAGQVNAQIPSNVGTGSQSVTVTTSGGTSSAFTLNINPLEPGLLALAQAPFLAGTNQYVVAQHLNGTFVLPASPATPAETLIIYGVGFGPANDSSGNAIPAGQIAPASSSLINPVQMTVGGKSATLTYQGLAPSLVGAYQFNLTAPSGVSGDSLLTFTQNGTPSTQKIYLAMQ